MTKRGAHDMGGDAAGPVDRHEHVPTLTERRIDAMMQLLRAKPREFWRTDENRRTIESLAPETYRDSSYYEKWTLAMRSLLVEKGVLSEAEIAARLAEVKKRFGRAGKTAAAPGKKAKAKTAGAKRRGGAAKTGSMATKPADPRAARKVGR